MPRNLPLRLRRHLALPLWLPPVIHWLRARAEPRFGGVFATPSGTLSLILVRLPPWSQDRVTSRRGNWRLLRVGLPMLPVGSMP